MRTLPIPVECRASADGPQLHGTVIQEGRASRGRRAEVFAPLSLTWPADGIAIRLVHLGPEETRAVPERQPDGRITVTAPATPAVMDRIRTAPHMSVEFHPVAETTTPAGVREVERALLSGAALVSNPEYVQAAAEVRDTGRRVWL